MNTRNLFMIINNGVQILPNTNMDHREWYTSLGLDLNNFENTIRGYVMDNKIVFFKGSSFSYDDETYKAALIYSPVIRNYFNNQNLEVCCGIIINQYDSKWEPVVKISNEEIVNYHPVVNQPIEKKDYSKVETSPIIEFKNNYEDKKFIKTAVIVTSIVLLLVIIIKIILFQEQKILQLSNPLDILLSAAQISLLGFSIYGYLKKLSYTKYISIIASVLVILTLDIYDIIIGIVYFLFSIDQNYFIKVINSIKKIIKKEK